MSPLELRALLLGIAAVLILILGTAAIYMVRRSRNVSRRRARRTKAAQRRVDTAIERAELGHSTITVPDRFGAMTLAATAGGTASSAPAPGGPTVLLTSEPQHGDLSASMVVPQPPFDVTDTEAWQRWQSCDRRRQRATMLAGYLSHPLPRVRAEALELLGSNQVDDPELPGRLALLLLEDDRTMRTRAARATWSGRRLPGVVGAVRERAAGDGSVARAYSDLEHAAPRDEALSLPQAYAGLHTGEATQASLIAELVELYAPDRAADRSPVPDLGRRLDVEGGVEAMRTAADALATARGSDAAADLSSRWQGVGSWSP